MATADNTQLGTAYTKTYHSRSAPRTCSAQPLGYVGCGGAHPDICVRSAFCCEQTRSTAMDALNPDSICGETGIITNNGRDQIEAYRAERVLALSRTSIVHDRTNTLSAKDH
ncbi:hypothetical protein MLPF_0361 [Mycobacterium lepromatosis]|nr:hypothetical protein MLPF_0361 [Mycobacterium lepromatosis]